jgi:Ca-activated chloride channel family protein
MKQRRETMKNGKKIPLVCLLIAFFVIAAYMMLAGVAGAEKAQGGNLIFILDASGSMWGQVEGKAKIAISKEVLADFIEGLPQGLNVGLIAYGHRRKGDCNDVEELVPLSLLDKEKLINRIKAISPKGKTPITLSVRLTVDKLKAIEEETTIILVSDGKETYEGDPCVLVKELKQSGIRFVMHVIGFDVAEEERKQLECIAEAGGGTYFAAKNAGEFQMAANEVVKKPEFAGGVLKVTATKYGKPFGAWVYVYRQGETKKLTDMHTTEKRPASFKLLPGVYDIKVKDNSVPEKPVVTVKGMEVKPGETLEKSVEFTKEGILTVTAVKEGKPFGAWVYVYRQSETKKLTDMHTTEKRPASFKLLPGVYDIKVKDSSTKSVKELKEITIESGKRRPLRPSFNGRDRTSIA